MSQCPNVYVFRGLEVVPTPTDGAADPVDDRSEGVKVLHMDHVLRGWVAGHTAQLVQVEPATYPDTHHMDTRLLRQLGLKQGGRHELS